MSVRHGDRKIAHSHASRARKLLNLLAVVMILGIGVYIAADLAVQPADVEYAATTPQPVESVLVDPVLTEPVQPVVVDVDLLAQPRDLFGMMLSDVRAIVGPIPDSMIASLKAQAPEQQQQQQLVEVNPS